MKSFPTNLRYLIVWKINKIFDKRTEFIGTPDMNVSIEFAKNIQTINHNTPLINISDIIFD